LVQLFHERVDVLAAMAARLFKVEYEAVSPSQRATAKSCVYALLYGASAGKVAEDNDLPLARATHFLAEFNRIFPSIQPALQRLVAQVARDGYIKTLFDRRRPLRLLSGSEKERASERRKAPNTLCQGSAADIVKAAMHRVLLQLHRQESQPLFGESVRLVMQLHDELVFEVRRERLQQVARVVVGCMESDARAPQQGGGGGQQLPQQQPQQQPQARQLLQLRVPLEVRTKIGVAWGSLVAWKVGDPLPP
jgi:DNA polymerase I-like protein with 3'-5' exonuclease and polymerase domains